MKTDALKGFVAAFLLITMSVSVSAAPGVPHQFFGDVLVNGQPAPDNYLVEAVINSVAKQTFTNDGTYGFDPVFYIEDPNNDRRGDKLTFYVGPDENSLVKAVEYTFNNGESTELELAITISSPPPSGGNTGGSSGGSRSSGGSAYVPATTTADTDDNETDDGDHTETNETVVCAPDWICTSWGECINGKQSRTCADKNECGSEEGRPELKQNCFLSEEDLYGGDPDEKDTVLNRITGAVVGGGVGTWGTLIGLLLIIGGVIGYVKTRGRSGQEPKKR